MRNREVLSSSLNDPKWYVWFRYIAFAFFAIVFLSMGLVLSVVNIVGFAFSLIFLSMGFACLVWLVGFYLARHGKANIAWLFYEAAMLSLTLLTFGSAFLPATFFPFLSKDTILIGMLIIGVAGLIGLVTIYLRRYDFNRFPRLSLILGLVSLIGVIVHMIQWHLVVG